MAFVRFVLRSVGLSFSVALRMAVVVAVAGYAFYLLFTALFNLPLPENNLILVAVIVAIVLFMPTLLFLYLSALRSGLVALRASGPTDIGTLAKSLFRMMRFNFMLLNLFITLFGFGLSVVYLSFFAPEFVELIRGGVEITSRAGLFSLFGTLGEIPLVIIGFFALGVCLANGATGVSMAATAATAAVRAPGHDLMWGLGRCFGQLFTVSVVFLLLPVLYGIQLLGGLDARMGDLLALPESTVLAVSAYLIWVGCFFAAAKSEAYVMTAEDIDHEHEEMMEALSGNFVEESPPDLRAMLDKRLEAARTVRKSKSRLSEDRAQADQAGEDSAVVDLRARQGVRERPRPQALHGITDPDEAIARIVPFPSPDGDQTAAADSSTEPTSGRPFRPQTRRADDPDPHEQGKDATGDVPGESSNVDSFEAYEWMRGLRTDSKSDIT